MNAGAQQLAARYIGAAKQAPDAITRSRILRNGAQAFAQLAYDPRNTDVRDALTAIGLDFAGAAGQASQEPTVSDFTQLLRDTHEAWQQLGPDAVFMSSPSMSATALQSAAALGGPQSNVSIQPVTFDAKATLGRAAQITPSPTQAQLVQGIVQSQTVAFWQGTTREAQAMSVDVNTVLTPLVPSSLLNQLSARPYAQIQYGSDGNIQNSATVDVGLGRRFTVVGNYVSVLVGMDPPAPNTTSPVLTLGASIGTFAAPSQAPAVRTVYVDGLQNGVNFGVGPLNIPLRAVSLLPPLNFAGSGGVGPGGGILWIDFFNLAQNYLTSWSFNYGNPLSAPNPPNLTPFALPPEAVFFLIKLTNNPGATINVSVPFQLSL